MSASAKSHAAVPGPLRVVGAAAPPTAGRSLRPAIDAAAATLCDDVLNGRPVCESCRADARLLVEVFLLTAPALELCSTAELAQRVRLDAADA